MMKRAQRNGNIEMLRCLLVFGVCVQHAIYAMASSGLGCAWLSSLSQWCVTGFAFITGWYGTTFSIQKIIKLYSISIYCATMYIVIEMLLGGTSTHWTILVTIKNIWSIAIGQWFLNAYVALLCLTPIINQALDSSPERKRIISLVLPVIILVYGWSFATTLPLSISGNIPHSRGIEINSFTTLLGAYIVARSIRILLTRQLLPVIPALKGVMCFFLVVSVIIIMFGGGDCNGPFALILTTCVFFSCLKLRLVSWINQIFIWIAPSVFSVYLMHSHGRAWQMLNSVGVSVVKYGVPKFAAYFFVAGLIFFVGLIFDLPRRILNAYIYKMSAIDE